VPQGPGGTVHNAEAHFRVLGGQDPLIQYPRTKREDSPSRTSQAARAPTPRLRLTRTRGLGNCLLLHVRDRCPLTASPSRHESPWPTVKVPAKFDITTPRHLLLHVCEEPAATGRCESELDSVYTSVRGSRGRRWCSNKIKLTAGVR